MTSFFSDLLSRIAERGRLLVERGPSSPDDGDALTLAEVLLSQQGEASGIALAGQLLAIYEDMDTDARREFFLGLGEQFGPDLDAVNKAAAKFREAPSPLLAMQLHEATEPRRQELIRRLNRAPDGTPCLVRMRRDLLDQHLPDHPLLAQVDHDFNHLLASWFNRGFLVLQRISWASPAVILEKIIRYEAVHEIRSWDDLRRRIQPPDRRCYAFFHPALVDEPLVFVEVALTRGIPGEIAPILAGDREAVVETADESVSETSADTAVFYSISNCQKGLRGLSFGNFLIKQVVEELLRDLPQLKAFVTLSPVPGFARWLDLLQEDQSDTLLSDQERQALDALERDDWHASPLDAAALEEILVPLAAYYFLHAKSADGAPFDPVARFHLGNGARLERINWLGDLSSGAMQKAAGFMVNYLYDLKDIEENHEIFVNERKVVASDKVRRLLKHEPLDWPRATQPPPGLKPQTATAEVTEDD